MSIVDKNSLAFIGYIAMNKCHGVSEELAISMLESNPSFELLPSWAEVAKIIADEAIRRYKAAEWPAEKPVLKVDILAITRDLSR